MKKWTGLFTVVVFIIGVGFAQAEVLPELLKSEWVEASSIAIAQDTVYYSDGNNVMEWEIGASSVGGTGIDSGTDGAYSIEVCTVVSDGQWPLAIVVRHPLGSGDASVGLELRFPSADWNAAIHSSLDFRIDEFSEWNAQGDITIESAVYQGEPSAYKVYLDHGMTKTVMNPEYHGAMLYFTSFDSAYAADTSTGEIKRIGDFGFGARCVATYKGDMILVLQKDTHASSWKIYVVDGQNLVMAEKVSFPFEHWGDLGAMTYSSESDTIYFACDDAIWKMTDFNIDNAVRIMDAPKNVNFIGISRSGKLVSGDGKGVFVSTLDVE